MTMSASSQHMTPSRHRCYGCVLRRHVTAAGLTAVPVAIAAKVVAAVASHHHVDSVMTMDRTDLLLLALCVAVAVIGIPVWGLIEHLVAHSRDTAADARSGQWLIDGHGRWWYLPTSPVTLRCDAFVAVDGVAGSAAAAGYGNQPDVA
jgi:hypothetical protein